MVTDDNSVVPESPHGLSSRDSDKATTDCAPFMSDQVAPENTGAGTNLTSGLQTKHLEPVSETKQTQGSGRLAARAFLSREYAHIPDEADIVLNPDVPHDCTGFNTVLHLAAPSSSERNQNPISLRAPQQVARTSSFYHKRSDLSASSSSLPPLHSGAPLESSGDGNVVIQSYQSGSAVSESSSEFTLESVMDLDLGAVPVAKADPSLAPATIQDHPSYPSYQGNTCSHSAAARDGLSPETSAAQPAAAVVAAAQPAAIANVTAVAAASANSGEQIQEASAERDKTAEDAASIQNQVEVQDSAAWTTVTAQDDGNKNDTKEKGQMQSGDKIQGNDDANTGTTSSSGAEAGMGDKMTADSTRLYASETQTDSKSSGAAHQSTPSEAYAPEVVAAVAAAASSSIAGTSAPHSGQQHIDVSTIRREPHIAHSSFPPLDLSPDQLFEYYREAQAQAITMANDPDARIEEPQNPLQAHLLALARSQLEMKARARARASGGHAIPNAAAPTASVVSGNAAAVEAVPTRSSQDDQGMPAGGKGMTQSQATGAGTGAGAGAGNTALLSSGHTWENRGMNNDNWGSYPGNNAGAAGPGRMNGAGAPGISVGMSGMGYMGGTGAGTAGAYGATGAAGAGAGGVGAHGAQGNARMAGAQMGQSRMEGARMNSAQGMRMVQNAADEAARVGQKKRKPKREFSENLGLHLLFVAMISVLLLIPTAFFGWVLDDRMDNEQYAIESMVTPWGKEQQLSEPELIVPVHEVSEIETTQSDNEVRQRYNRIRPEEYYVSPVHAATDVFINSEKRYRGNYETTLYTLEVTQEAQYDLKSALDTIRERSIVQSIDTSHLNLVFNISRNKGIDEIKYILINGKLFTPMPAGKYSGFMVSLNEDDVSRIMRGETLDPTGRFEQELNQLQGEVPALFNRTDAESARREQDKTAVAVMGERTRYKGSYEPGRIYVSARYYVRGSQSLSFMPIAQVSEFNVAGSGVLPSFNGGFLPRERLIEGAGRSDVNTYTSSDLADSVGVSAAAAGAAAAGTAGGAGAAGGRQDLLDRTQGLPRFKASYYQNSLSTGMSTIHYDNEHFEGYGKEERSYRIDLSDTSDSYMLISRLTKYVLLFIAMTYVTVLAFEIVTRQVVSLVQYVTVGAAIVLFYMVLLALSEHISFTLSYVIGAILMTAMISLYLKAVLNSIRYALCVAALLLSMYAVLYAIVHVEAYALLIGTTLLVIMLGIVMFITRGLNRQAAVGSGDYEPTAPAAPAFVAPAAQGMDTMTQAAASGPAPAAAPAQGQAQAPVSTPAAEAAAAAGGMGTAQGAKSPGNNDVRS